MAGSSPAMTRGKKILETMSWFGWCPKSSSRPCFCNASGGGRVKSDAGLCTASPALAGRLEAAAGWCEDGVGGVGGEMDCFAALAMTLGRSRKAQSYEQTIKIDRRPKTVIASACEAIHLCGYETTRRLYFGEQAKRHPLYWGDVELSAADLSASAWHCVRVCRAVWVPDAGLV